MTSRAAIRLLIGAIAAGTPQIAAAQPADLPIAPATTDRYPPGVKVVKTASGKVYADQRGLTLYGMDMRTVLRWSPDPARFCKDTCRREWEPVLAPAGSVPNIRYPGPGSRNLSAPEGMVHPQKAPDWTIIAGADGPQWVYKGWHLVFTRRGSKAGSVVFDGADNRTWNTLKFVPPVPTIIAPRQVATAYVGDSYAFTSSEGHVLFTGRCTRDCAGWTPLPAGMASSGVGEWKVNLAGDQAQWTWRGKPVFVSQGKDPQAVPPGSTILRP